ncbi:MAG: transaldolase family protein, partial [Alphaproteobacteria bacterium]|nr:transaldolase family protein [Alphaproteobacteria bacterium]
PTLNTDILVASIRNPRHVERAAEVGADVGTLPPRVIWDMYQHPLTSKGLDDFMADWAGAGQSIL